MTIPRWEHFEARSLGSSRHRASRRMSRYQTLRRFRGRQSVEDLAARGVPVRVPSSRVSSPSSA